APRPPRRVPTLQHSFLPRLDVLEDRTLPSLTFTVLNNFDSGAGSLRQAILDANANAGPDTIAFAPPVHQITLTGGELAITDSLNIAGPGANKLTVSGNDASRVLDVESGTVAIAGLTISHGRAGKGAAHYESTGGGILNLAGLTLSGVVLSG